MLIPKEDIDIDPDKRDWEYDKDGTRIYKESAGYPTKRLWKEFFQKGMYHNKIDYGINKAFTKNPK